MDWRLFYFNVTTCWDSDIPWKILTISSEIFLKVHQCILHISRAHISKIKMCYNVESSAYFFKGRRRSWHFKICISAPLVKPFRMYWKMLISYHSINEIWNNKQIIKQHSLFYQIYPTLRMNYLLSNIIVFRKQPFSSSVVVLGRNTVLSNDY